MMNNTKTLIDGLKNAVGARFVGVTYQSKSTGEVARFVLLVGVNYDEVVKASITELEIQRPNLRGIDLQACDELLASFNATLEAHKVGEENPDYTKAGMYATITKGIKINLNDNTLEIAGLVHSKVVIHEGKRKKVKSRPLTIAKNDLRGACRIGKWRTLALDAELVKAKFNGETLDLN
jgi:hypothetical protein